MKRLSIRRVMLSLTVGSAVVLLAVAVARYTVVARAGATAPRSVAPRSVMNSRCLQPRWAISPVLNPPNSFPTLYSVAATAFNDVWAVGYDNPNGGAGQQFIEHFNGSTWSISPVPANRSFLYGVVALAPNNAWTAGSVPSGTLVEHWDGSVWSAVTSPNHGSDPTQLRSIAAVSASDIWAVGFYSFNSNSDSAQFIMHWNGTSWSSITGPSNGLDQVTLTSVAVSAATDVWIVGNGVITGTTNYRAFVEHWNGSAWTVTVFAPDPTSGKLPELNAVAAKSGGAWVVGTMNDPTTQTAVPLVEHWNGASWSIIPSAATGGTYAGFTAIAFDRSGNGWAVGSDFPSSGYASTHALIERWTGGSFSIVPDATGASQYAMLNAVTAVPNYVAFTVGTTGTTNALGQALAEKYSAPEAYCRP